MNLKTHFMTKTAANAATALAMARGYWESDALRTNGDAGWIYDLTQAVNQASLRLVSALEVSERRTKLPKQGQE